jgi:hypothetical protein
VTGLSDRRAVHHRITARCRCSPPFSIKILLFRMNRSQSGSPPGQRCSRYAAPKVLSSEASRVDRHWRRFLQIPCHRVIVFHTQRDFKMPIDALRIPKAAPGHFFKIRPAVEEKKRSVFFQIDIAGIWPVCVKIFFGRTASRSSVEVRERWKMLRRFS